ncbi:MAG: cell division protein FtsQ/DivIB [Gammaproteobacteria bacterium]|nr:cell division protein FtsQ/DivIB [Gammaproteobacteria bacterium]MDE0224524.1 cell division protein FtsQ/DivIB [Gammaproteobacteria bacterium]MDE0451950.1 cell division protein FtsQ/DivIB [Gammaproteobacteria bacterium]
MRIKSLLAVLMLVAVVGAGTAAVWRFLDTPLELVRIAGDLTEIERQEIRAAVRETLDSAATGVADVVEAIDALGWTRNTRVRLIGSGALDVSVERESLAARWGNAEYVTAAGEVVGAPGPPDREGALPRLSGTLSTSGEAMQVYGKLSARLADIGLTLKSLEETKVGGWQLVVEDDITVLLGAEDINGRLERVLAVYANALTQRMEDVDRIDARYGSGVAVRWRDELTEEAVAWNPGPGAR